MKEALLKIHEIKRIQQKNMILRGLFVKVIIFQLLRKYRRLNAVNFHKYDLWKHSKEPLFKIHEITRIQQKYIILIGLFLKVIIFQLLRKYRRATAVNFYICDVWKHLRKPFLKMHEITRIQQKYIILREFFVKVIIFQLLRKYSRATAVNFHKYDVLKYLKETFFKIHQIIRIQQKNMILTTLFVKVIIFEFSRKYTRATAVNFDIWDVTRTF